MKLNDLYDIYIDSNLKLLLYGNDQPGYVTVTAPYESGSNESSSATPEAETGGGWTMQTDKALAQANFISDMSGENARKALDKNAVLYEMAAAAETGSNVNIVIENLKLTNGGKSLTAEEYINMAIGGLESRFKEAFVALDVNVDVKTGKSTTDFLGSGAACINIKVATVEQVLFQKMIPLSGGHIRE